MKQKLKAFAWIIIAQLAYWLFALVRLTWTLEEQELPEEVKKRYKENKVVVFGHFHEDDWPMISFYFRRPMIVLVSLSKDGSLLTLFLKKLGYTIARGSSSRGAVKGFKNLVEICRSSGVPNVSLAVDGPRGPRREAKKGILRLAYILKSPVVFAIAKVEGAWVAEKSWSKAVLPKPFAKQTLKYKVVLSQEEVQQLVDSKQEAKALELIQSRLQSLLV